MASTTFYCRGLPYISKSYKGDLYTAVRHKIKQFFCPLGDIQKLFVDMNAGFVSITIKDTVNGRSNEIKKILDSSDTNAMRFSWDLPIGSPHKREADFLQPHVSLMWHSTPELPYKCTAEYRDNVLQVEMLDAFEEFERQCDFEEIDALVRFEIEATQGEEIEEYDVGEEATSEITRNPMVIEMDVDEDTDDEDSDEEEDIVPRGNITSQTTFTLDQILEIVRAHKLLKHQEVYNATEIEQMFTGTIAHNVVKPTPSDDISDVFNGLSLN